MTDTPAMSAVLVTDTFDTVRESIDHLGRQPLHDRLELLIATSSDGFELDPAACAPFHSVRVVAVDSIDVLGLARAAAMRVATAPVILVAETHSFPGPGTLAALLERHREPWAVVGPAIRNGNPGSTISWSSVLMDYGSQLEGAPSGPVGRIASHNSSYKRSALVDLGDELESSFGAGDVLNDAIVARGGQLYFEGGVHTSHLNVSRRESWVRERVAAGRAFAGYRARHWHPWKRAAYAVAAPLIPFVRLTRIRVYAQRVGVPRRVYPTLFAGLCLSALGELVGYVGGVGSGERSVSAMEIDRRRHLRGDDPPVFDDDA